jgi:hypothetical protein
MQISSFSLNPLTTVPKHSRLEPSDRTGWFLRICITLATVLFLAYAARNNLSYLFHSSNQEQSTFTIQATASKDKSPKATSHELWIRAIISDGQLLRGNTVDRTNNWEVVERGGLPPLLRYREDSKPALLTFQGRNLVTIFKTNQWSGAIRVERDGREVKVVNLQGSEEQERPIVVEDPEAPPSVAVFVVASILFAVCAWWFGPIRTSRRNILWLIFFLSIIHFLFWTSQCVGTTYDSPSYLQTVTRFFLEGEPSYFPPGYPALLGVVGTISGDNLGRWVTLVQHGMLVLACVWIYLLLRRIMSDELALLGGILAGALAPSLTTSQAVLSEAPTLFTMLGALYFTVRSAETGRLLFAILAGLLTGWAGILRLAPLAGLLPSICMVYLLPVSKDGFRRLGIALIVTAVVVLTPVWWCWHKSGHPQLSNSLGLHLFNRVVAEQKLLDEDAPATRTLLNLLEGKDPRGVPWWEITKQGGLLKLGDLGRRHLLRNVSLEGIHKDPWGYLSFTPHLALKMFLTPSDWIPTWGETIPVSPRLENPPPLIFTASSLNWRMTLEKIHRVLWPIICWTAVAGTFLGLLLPQRILILALAWIPTGYLLSTALVEKFDPRYNSSIAPFVVALSMVPLAMVLTFFNLKLVKQKVG